MAAARDPQHAGRSGLHVALQQARLRGRPEDRHRPRVGDGGRDRPQADPLADLEALRELDCGVGKRAPAVVGLGPGQDEDVAPADASMPDDELGPLELGRPAVDDLERGAAGAVVEQVVRVERHHRLAALGQVAGGEGRGRAGVDPAVEGCHERRRVERGPVVEAAREAVDRHGSRIGQGSPGDAGACGAAAKPRGRFSP